MTHRPDTKRSRFLRSSLTALAACAALVAGLAPPAHAGNVPQDDEIKALLKRADDLFERDRVREGVKAYLLIEDRLDALRAGQTAGDAEALPADGEAPARLGAPIPRPLVEFEPGVFRALPDEIAARVRARGPEALEAYRDARSPHIRALLAEAGARPFDPSPLAAILGRYPLAEEAPAIRQRLADLHFEAGRADAAARAYREAQPNAEGAAVERMSRALEALAKLDSGLPERAERAWSTWFGDPTRARALPSADVPGALVFAGEIPSSELGLEARIGFARRGAALPRIYHPVADGARIYLADSKVVRAVDARTGRLVWLYMARDPDDARSAPPLSPDRLGNMLHAPTLAAGAIYASLNRNTPAIYDPEGEPTEDGQPDPHLRARDWRLVALDAATGRLRWDASERSELDALSRTARFVSSPLVTGGHAVYSVLVNEQGTQGDLAFEVWVLDATNGALQHRIRVCSGLRFDYLGLAAWCPPPSARGGIVYVATHLGIVAALDVERGAVRWASAYPEVPRESQKRLIERGRRFAPLPLLAAEGAVVVCPQDSVFALGVDPDSGRELWRVRRGPHDKLIGAAGGRVILAGSDQGGVRVLAIDERTGRIAWQHRHPGPKATVHGGLATLERTLVVVGGRLLALDTATGALRADVDLPPEVDGGPIAPLPGGDFVLVDATRVARLEAASRSRSRLEAARKADPRPEALLPLAAFLARQGDAKEAVDMLLPAIERAEREPERAALAEALREAASAAATRAARDATTEADRFDQEVLAALLAPPRPQALVALRDLADRLLDAGHEERAVRLFAEAAGRLGNVRFPIAPGVSAQANLWARQRLYRLRIGSREALTAFDAAAKQALERVLQKSPGSPEALEAVATQFPTTPAEAEALDRLADLFEARGLGAVADRVLSDRVRRFPEDPGTAKALWRRVRLLAAARRSHEEEEALRQLVGAFPDHVREDGGRTRALAEARLAELAAGERLPWLATGFDPDDLKSIFHTSIDLAQGEAELLEPAGFDSATTFLVGGASSIESRLTETGIKRWRATPRPSHQAFRAVFQLEHLAAAGRSLAVGVEENQGRAPAPLGGAEPEAAPAFLPPNLAREAVLSLDLESGRTLFRVSALDALRLAPGQRPDQLEPLRTPEQWLAAVTAIEEAFGVGLASDPDPITGLAAAGDSLIAVVGPAVVSLDALNGALRWRVTPEGTFRGNPRAATAPDGSARLVLFQEAPAGRMVSLDLATGAERASVDLGPHSARLTLRPVFSAANADRAFCCAGGNRLVRLDLGACEAVTLKELGFWPRTIVAEPRGNAVAVIPHREGTQPAVVVYDASTGEVLTELRPAEDPRRIANAVFAGPELYVTASGSTAPGGPATSILHAIDWRLGRTRWTWSPQPTHLLDEVVPTENHLVLPRSGLHRPGVLYVLDRARGRIYRRFELPRRRTLDARVVDGQVLVATTRGVTGIGRVDPARNQEELSEITAALEVTPGEASLFAVYANRRFRAGDSLGAERALEAALTSETLRLREYDLLQDQLAALQQQQEGKGPLVEIPKLARPPVIDGELQDAWPIEQSFALQSQRHITTIQGPPGVSVLRGDDDLSAQLFVGYDDRYFYFALDVTDSSLVPYDTEADDWRGDCLLIATDAAGNGGDYYASDDNLMSLALALPKRKKDGEPEDEEEEEEDDPKGQYFVKRKEDGSGAVYECAIPWSALQERGARVDPVRGPEPGFTFGFNFVLTDDDDGGGSRKTLQWSPSIWLHETKRNIWEGFIPERFVRVRCK